MSVAVARRSFAECLGIQMRVIGAIILRELHTRYGRENIGYLWMIAEPLLLASVIAIVHVGGGHSAGFGGDMQPVPFAVLGYTCYICFRGIISRSEGSLEHNAPLLYHRQVTTLDLTIARALLEWASTFSTMALIMTVLICIGAADLPARPLIFIAAWIYMFAYCVGHSLIIAAITYENRTVGRLVHPYNYFMVFLSASFMQVKWLPHPVREIFTYIPITSILELLRHGWFEEANLDYFFPFYLTSTCVLLIWVGLVLNSRMRDRIHVA